MKEEKEYLLKYLKRVAGEIEEMHPTFSASVDRSGADWELVVKFRGEQEGKKVIEHLNEGK